MNRADVIARLKAAEPRIRAHGVAALYLFGSYARDEADDDSDVDVFVDPQDETEFSIARSMETLAILEEALPGTQIGYGTRANIVPVYLSSIEAAAIKIFG